MPLPSRDRRPSLAIQMTGFSHTMKTETDAPEPEQPKSPLTPVSKDAKASEEEQPLIYLDVTIGKGK